MSVFSWRNGVAAALVGVIGTAGLSGLASPATASMPASVPSASEPQDPGRWTIEPAPDGGASVTWTSPEVLPVGGARPEFLLDGVALGPVLMDPDGRTLRLADPLTVPPDPADLDVELSGRLLDEPAPPTAPRAAADPAPAGPILPDDPTVPGPYAVADADYQLPSFRFGRMRQLEMVGHVVAPVTAPGPRPVVLLLHGRHDWCYVPEGQNGGAYDWPCQSPSIPVPSHLGYTYVQELLASQGYLTVSVSANGINGQDGMLEEGGADARAALVRRHLDALEDLSALADLGVTADLDRVVLIGHSRGGEGVNRAAETIPLDAPYRVVGQVLLGPTNVGRQAAAYVPTVSVLPFCDGDVSDLQGQLFTDVARDAAADDDALHSTVLVMGANHNFFNTEWTPGISAAPSFDDNGDTAGPCEPGTATRLSAEQQREVGAAYLAAAVATFGGSADYLPLFDGSGARVMPTSDFDIRSHTLGAGRDVRRPGAGLDADPTDPSTRLCVGRIGDRPNDCLGFDPDGEVAWSTPHFTGFGGQGFPSRKAVELTWTASDPEGRLLLAEPLDVSGAARLEVRTLLPLGADAAGFDVNFTDGAGHTDTVVLGAGEELPAEPLREYGGTAVAQVLRVPTTGLDPALDATDLRSVTLVARGGSGRAWVLDLAAVTSGALPSVPEERLRTLSFDRLKITEGDGADRQVELPYVVSGPAGVDGQIRIATTRIGRQGYPVSGPAMNVTVPAGSTGGSVTFEVPANRLDDLNRTLTVNAYPISGVMPASYVGALRIIDDDPTPALRTSVRVTPVTEGQSLVFEARLARPVGYWTGVDAFPVAGTPQNRLRIGDLDREFVKSWGFPDRLTRPHRLYAGQNYFSFCEMNPGQDHCVLLRLPVRVDDRAEGRERVTLQVHAVPRSRRDWVSGRVRDR